MKYPVYSIHDALVGFNAPNIMNNDAFAMRAFKESFSDVNNASDYSLFKIGDFDTETGDLIPCAPFKICMASDFVKGESDVEK